MSDSHKSFDNGEHKLLGLKKSAGIIFGRNLIIGLIVVGLACGLVLVAVPRLMDILTYHLGYDQFKDLFFSRLGFSAAASDLIAGALAFFFPLASTVVLVNIFAVWAGRADPARVAKVFVAYAFVYLLPAAVILVSDSFRGPICFDQVRGEPRMFYTIQSGGIVDLSDSKGFDRFGVERKPVNSEICLIADRQRSGTRPKRISTDNLANIEYFDANGMGAKVFYSRNSDGQLELFDGPGVNPVTNAILIAVTPDVVTEIKRSLESQEQQRVDAERQRREEQAKESEEQARQQAEIAKQRAAQEQADLQAVQARAQAAEEARKRQVDEATEAAQAKQREKERAAQEARAAELRQQEAEAIARIQSAQRIEAAHKAAAEAK